MHPLLSRPVLIILVVVAIFAAWSDSFFSPLVFDDLSSIQDNTSVRPPYSFKSLLNPPSESGPTVAGRPILNISFAFNYWLAGENYIAYRVTNLLIHIANALLILGIANQSLRLSTDPPTNSKLRQVPVLLSLIWALHPLTTSAVSYLAQRAESLVCLFILLTLYTFARSLRSHRPFIWLSISLISCYLGAATKEVMVAAPLIVLLYAYIFQSDNPKPNKRARLTYFTLLFASWIPLLLLTSSTGDRASTANLSLGSSYIEYLKFQTEAIARYLRLSVWPDNLVFDYGRELENSPAPIWITRGVVILILLVTSLVLAYKKSPLGFLGVSAFLILTPTSIVFPSPDPIFEHRFYLPLACVSAFVILAIYTKFGKKTPILVLPLALGLSIITYQRNFDYQDPLSLWQGSLDYNPQNARAQTKIGTILLANSEEEEAMQHFETALEIRPTPLRYHNLANSQALLGNFDAAIPNYKKALQADPNFQPSLIGLAQALAAKQDYAAALSQYKAFLALNPNNIEALRGLAEAQDATKDTEGAIKSYQRICELDPRNVAVQFDLADALSRTMQFDESIAAYRRVIQLDPQNARALSNLGNLYLLKRDYDSAIGYYQQSLQQYPNSTAHTNLAICLISKERIQEAKTELQKALALDPTYTPAINLARKHR